MEIIKKEKVKNQNWIKPLLNILKGMKNSWKKEINESKIRTFTKLQKENKMWLIIIYENMDGKVKTLKTEISKDEINELYMNNRKRENDIIIDEIQKKIKKF